MRTEKEIIAASKEFIGENKAKSWFEFLITVVLISSLLTLCFFQEVPFLARLAASITCGLLYVRLFVIYHDYRHRSILLGSTVASLLMKLVGLYVLAPEQIWTRSHEHHHNNNSKLTMSGIGSYPTVSKSRFLKLTKAQRQLYLINRHPLTIIFGYFTLFIYWLNLKSFLESPRKHIDSLAAIVLHVAVAAVIWYFFGFVTYVLTWFLPIFIMSGMGAYLFYCQHNFPGAKFRENHDWSYTNAALSSTSYMVMSPVMHWFTANIGYHHVHHINSRIPFYRLKEAMKSMPELSTVVTTSWNPIDIWRCFRLKVWDDETEQMITLRQLKSTQSAVRKNQQAVVAEEPVLKD
ncbi:MAG: fatty acid desaturase [Cyclobacteriaceae bacterium]|nr:fatty acid desaturase [Cyclobacteriaceae bacterium]